MTTTSSTAGTSALASAGRRADKPGRDGKRTFHWERVPPKTVGSRHHVPLAPLAVEALREWYTRQAEEAAALGAADKQPTGLVFTSPKGYPWHARAITEEWWKALAKAELPSVRFHDLRHTAATIALSSGYTLEDVKQLLGHSTITLTSNTYSHPLATRMRDVVVGMEATLTRSRTRSGSEPGTAREDPGERPV
jgi:integrase